jgi:membrane protein DedA with SNARE-associated domain
LHRPDAWIFSPLIPSLRNWLIAHPEAILALVFGMAMLEAVAIIGAIIPGVALLFVLSVLAAHAHIDFSVLLVIGIAGAMAGDGISYAIGRTFQHRIEHVWPFRKYPHWLGRSEAYVEQHGGKGIIFGRFIGPLRAFVPMAAGIFRMKPLYFLWMNFLSALAWAPFHLVPGYSFGMAAADNNLPGRDQLLFIAALLILVAVLAWLLPIIGNWLKHHPIPNSGIHYDADGQPQRQRVTLWLAGVGLVGFILTAGSLPLLQPLDHWLAQELITFRHPLLDHLFVALDTLGDQSSLLVFGAVLLGWLLLRGEWRTAALVVLAAGIGLTLPAFLKYAGRFLGRNWWHTLRPHLRFPVGMRSPLLWYGAFYWSFLDVCSTPVLCSGSSPYWRPHVVHDCITPLPRGVHWVSDIIAGASLGLTVVGPLALGVASYA